MKRTLLLATFVLGGISPTLAANPGESNSDWQLVFYDDFSGSSLNTSNWSRIPYVSYNVAAWRKYQSTDEALVQLNPDTGTVTLVGTYGDYTSQNDQAGENDTFACGGLTTMNTFTFQYGYVEVRARFDCAAGVWPAIWMMPVDGSNWPSNGEIDIMEHLAYQGTFYQTLHYGTSDAGKTETVVEYAKYNDSLKTDWHTYGMEWTEDYIKFYLDGSLTATRVANEKANWPFSTEGNEFYLYIDQQIGGSWVENLPAGAADATALAADPADFEIDYVKVYSSADYMHNVPEPATVTLSLLGLAGLALRRHRR